MDWPFLGWLVDRQWGLFFSCHIARTGLSVWMSDLHDPSRWPKVKMCACVRAWVIREAFLSVNIQQGKNGGKESFKCWNVYFSLAVSHHAITQLFRCWILYTGVFEIPNSILLFVLRLVSFIKSLTSHLKCKICHSRVAQPITHLISYIFYQYSVEAQVSHSVISQSSRENGGVFILSCENFYI